MAQQHAPVSTSRLANKVAQAIRDAFSEYHDQYRAITRRAACRFAECDWHGMQVDARERLEIHDRKLQQLLIDIRKVLVERFHSRMTWVGIKAVYSGLIAFRDDWEIAETFFNSVTRRVFTTVGIDPEIEFVHTDYPMPPTPASELVYRKYQATSISELTRRVLSDYEILWTSQGRIENDIERIAERVATELPDIVGDNVSISADFAKAIFYRGRNAYLMGRIQVGSQFVPFVLCFANAGEGPYVDAVLLNEDDVSLLFSYTRSYFLVDVQRPCDLVTFIQSLIPYKRIAEIYISLGYNKHGKTELYRHALHHLAESHDLYQLAEGQRGMVMVVFTMPSYPVVFKVIRDKFDYPKECSHLDVIDRYQLVFKHDRAGRLVDAQEYKHLVLDRQRFDDELLEELHAKARHAVLIERDQVIIKHGYAERRVTPLNVYLQQADKQKSLEAVIDYGQAIKDLASTNLFPGDLLPKNFGLTRNGRIVFYDYDDICLLTECNFRKIPHSPYYEDELAGEPWYSVGPNDIFPEEFIHFLGLSPELKEVFVSHHANLLDASYWDDLKQRIASGELYYVAPYSEAQRLRTRPTRREMRKRPTAVALSKS